MSASKDLGPHALRLYLYLASNANNYELALSPAAITEEVGIPRSTYHDQFQKLIQHGYVVPVYGNKYEFYEVPQSGARQKNSKLGDGQVDENATVPDTPVSADGQGGVSQNTEINNTANNQINGIDNAKILKQRTIPKEDKNTRFVF